MFGIESVFGGLPHLTRGFYLSGGRSVTKSYPAHTFILYQLMSADLYPT
jgi:hypothetical protein